MSSYTTGPSAMGSSIHAESPRGVVQWVEPKRIPTSRNKENIKTRSNKPPAADYDSDQHQHSPNNTTSNSFANYHYEPSNNNNNNNSNSGLTYERKPPFHEQNLERAQSTKLNDSSIINSTHCRTISVIVEQYIGELKEHQQKINSARAKLVRSVQHYSENGNFIANNDLARLRVRDEQTKAIETIKQLTNYLRELSSIKKQLDSATEPINEDIYNKLSDVRNNIIQALNDFVLANSDIDFPIIDPKDPNAGDYDLCIDAQRSNHDIRKIEISQSSGNTTTTKPMSDMSNSFQEAQPSTLQSNDCDDQQYIKSLERQKRELHKLEKDTVELRQLFADFYNLVKVQGQQVDTIEDNIVMAAQHIDQGRQDLKPRPGLTVLVPLTGCITGALIGGPIGFIVGGKIGGVSIICATSLLGLLSSLGAQKCMNTGRVKHNR